MDKKPLRSIRIAREPVIWWAFFAGVTALSAVGCGQGGATRYHLAGKITYAGKPIPEGIIFFDPDLAAGHDGPQGHAVIKNGVYDTRNEGLGPGGGKYVLRLYALDGIPGPEAASGRPLFPEYTWREELPTQDATKDFNVTRQAVAAAATASQ